MNDAIQFFYNPMSRARIAHWALEEVGAPFELTLLDFEKREHKQPEYLRVNPMGKVPAIVHRGQVVTENAAILTYLGDAFPQAKLAPSLDDPQRGSYLRWMFFIATNWEAAVLDKNMPRKSEVPASALGYGSYDDTANAIEKAMTPGPFLLGDRFTMADLLAASQIGWSLFNKWIEPRPAFVAYIERCQQRPAWKRANEQAMKLSEQLKSSK